MRASSPSFRAGSAAVASLQFEVALPLSIQAEVCLVEIVHVESPVCCVFDDSSGLDCTFLVTFVSIALSRTMRRLVRLAFPDD